MNARTLILGLLLTAVLAAYVPSAQFGSVQPLYLDETVSCTAFSVSKKDRLWVTAGHCTTQGDKACAIGSLANSAIVVRRDELHDLALLQGGLPAEPLDLANSAPRVGDSIVVEGFPMGTPQPVLFFGRLSSVSFVFPKETEAVAVMDLQGLPGVSGAPMLVRGDVIGVFSGIYKGQVGQVSWGVTWARLKDFVGPAWEGE